MTIGTTYETDVHVPHIMDVARRTIIIAVYSPINTILMLQRAHTAMVTLKCCLLLVFAFLYFNGLHFWWTNCIDKVITQPVVVRNALSEIATCTLKSLYNEILSFIAKKNKRPILYQKKNPMNMIKSGEITKTAIRDGPIHLYMCTYTCTSTISVF